MTLKLASEATSGVVDSLEVRTDELMMMMLMLKVEEGWEGTLLLLPICEILLTGGLLGGDAGEVSGLLKVREGETW